MSGTRDIQSRGGRLAALGLLLLLATSCTTGQLITERRINRYYRHKPVKPTFHTIQNDSVTLHYASVGADTLPLLLLIHGAPGGWYGFLNMLEDTLLQRNFRVVAVDRLGYGKSLRKNQLAVTSIQKQAQSLLPLLNQVPQGKQAIVVGRSYGAAIAAQLTLYNPGKVRHLVMVSPPIDPEKEKIFWFARAARYRAVQWFLPQMFVVATAEKFAHAAELRELKPRWQELDVPLTVFQGGRDWIADPLNLDFARQHIKCKRAKFLFLPEAGHYITDTHAKLVKECVLEAAHAALESSVKAAGERDSVAGDK